MILVFTIAYKGYNTYSNQLKSILRQLYTDTCHMILIFKKKEEKNEYRQTSKLLGII